MDNDEGVPNSEQVRMIYKETYNFYTKWIAVNEPDWDLIIAKSREIEQKYPFELCQKILVELVSIIETSYMGRSEIDGA